MKNLFRFLFLGSFVLSFLSASVLALPIDFDWTNRPVAVRLSATELSGKQPAAFMSAGHPISVKVSSESIAITTYLDKSMLGYDYAIRFKGNKDTAIYVNGRLLESDPVIGPDGTYNCILKQYLQAGDNVIEFNGAVGLTASITEVEVFALLFSNEEVHFDRVFGTNTTIVGTQPASDNEQLKYDILHYDLSQVVTMTSSAITANLTMIAKNTTVSLRTAVFDLDDNSGSFSVQSVDRGPGTSTLSYTHNGSSNRLFVPLPSAPLPMNSIFTVRVFYAGTPNSSGTFGAPYRRTTHSGTAIVYSFSEPYGARQWWPCKDTPEDKATIDSHWTCPTSYTPVSNGRLVSVTTSGSNHTFNYSESYPLSSYLVSVACTNYQYLYGVYTSLNLSSTMVVGGYIFPENSWSESTGVPGTITMIRFFANKFGEYPFLSEKYVTAEHTITSSMEHQTCTSLRPYGLETGGFTRSNIHELAHQWFGDMITMQHFNHLWLNEGFGTYAEALWQENFNGTYGTDSYHAYVNAWSTSDSYALVSNSADNFSGSIVYRKGAWVLHMLRHILGDTTFFAALKNYAADTALRYGNAVSLDFQHDVEKTMGGSTSMSWFFDEWLNQANRPNYTWSCVTHAVAVGSPTTVLDITITQTQSAATYIMPIDFKVTFLPSGSTTVKIWNTQYAAQTVHISLGTLGKVTTVTIDPDNWILDYNNASVLTPGYLVVPVELSRFETELKEPEYFSLP
ncbi:MAG: M1 family metallopeptidase [bacterium]